MITVEEALKIILKNTHSAGKETVGISCALGRVLQEDVYAKNNVPSFDRAAMDGFAVRARDLKGAGEKHPVILSVLGDIPAGTHFKKKIKPGSAVKIMTGAPVPDGADAVVMVEDTSEIMKGNERKVEVYCGAEPGENVGKSGEDVKKGELILKRGKELTPSDIAMLGALGYPEVKVSCRPRVYILSTGDEVIEPGRRLSAGQVYDANSFGLSSQVLSCGGEPHRLGIAKDSRENLVSRLKNAKDADVLILSGGVSVGDYDLVKEILPTLGVRMLFYKVRIRPGKPVFFGRKGKCLVFGLPGYPVSSMVTFELFVKPALRALAGCEPAIPEPETAILQNNLKVSSGRRNFLRGLLTVTQGKNYVTPIGIQKSGILKSLVLANCLIEIPENLKRLKKGSIVTVRRIGVGTGSFTGRSP